VPSEQAAMRAADSLDAFGRQDLAEGQALTGNKGVDNPTKTAADSSGRSRYLI